MQLQVLLNQNPATAIQGTGPGSRGQETEYFGFLTQAAVSRFQEKYYAEILAPNGLNWGTGFVGPSTRAVLNGIAMATTSLVMPLAPVSTASVSAGSPTLLPVQAPTASASTTPASANPNMANLDIFFADLDQVSSEQNIPAARVALIKSQVLQIVATTTDLTKEFEGVIGQSVSSSATGGDSIAALWDWFEGNLSGLIAPHKALAQAATVPFGGRLFFALPCTCTGGTVWLLTIQPIPPTYATLLEYVQGTQLYLNRNIPVTTELLGRYIKSTGGGLCYIVTGPSCTQMPSVGRITPIVGSSL